MNPAKRLIKIAGSLGNKFQAGMKKHKFLMLIQRRRKPQLQEMNTISHQSDSAIIYYFGNDATRDFMTTMKK